jgi:hypothetical protein
LPSSPSSWPAVQEQQETVAARLYRDARHEVEQERRSSTAAVESYAPKVKGQIDGLAALALRLLTSVVNVEVLVAAVKPTHRIIQLRDWRFVPRELFATDIRQQVERPVTDEEIDNVYQEFFWRWNLFKSSRKLSSVAS